MKNLRKNTLLVVFGSIIVFLVWLLWDSQTRLNSFKEQVSKFEISKQFFNESLSNDSTIIAEQEQIILSQKEAIELGVLEVEKLKKVKSQVKTITITKIDSVFIEFHDTLRISDTIYPTGTIKVPKRFNLNKEHYRLGGIVLLDGLLVDSLKVKNEMKLTIANKSMGFLKKSKPVVQIENTNPYISTIDMKNIIIEDKRKFYDKKTFWLGLGVLTGLLIVK